MVQMLRTIKSFVTRTGRVSNRQQYALDNWLQNYELPLDGNQWNMPEIFGREADTVVEIGFGMGASLYTMASCHPESNFIGIEVHRAGVGSLAADLHDNGITNVRLVADDAVDIFKQHLNNNSIAGVQIFFPDPWHKKKHNKRRLIQPGFVELIVQKLVPGGFIHCATDWEEYAIHMMNVLSSEPALYNSQSDGSFSPRPESRPETKFERRGKRLGHGVWDLIYYKHESTVE